MMLHAARAAWGDARRAAAALIRARTRERDAMRAAKEADAATGSKRELAATRVLTARLEAHCGALLVVVNALRLCAPGERSVALSDEDGEGFDDDKKETDAAGGKAAKRRRVPGRGRATLADLLREYALAATRLELLVAGADVASLGFAEESALPTAAAADGGGLAGRRARRGRPGPRRRVLRARPLHRGDDARDALDRGRGADEPRDGHRGDARARAARANRRRRVRRAASLSLDPSSLEPGGGAEGTAARWRPRGLLGGDLGEVAGRDSDRGDSPDPAACWSALRSFLETHDSPARGHRLTEAAARCALAAAPAPAAAVAPGAVHVGPGRERRGGMARRGANPRRFCRRVPAPRSAGGGGAAALAELGRRRARGPAMPERAKHCAAWFPEPRCTRRGKGSGASRRSRP